MTDPSAPGGRRHEKVLLGFLPAYLFSGLAAFRAALDLGHHDPGHPPRWRRALAGLGLGAAALLVVLLPAWLLPLPRYERSTGPYRVGTRAESWIDSSRLVSRRAVTGDGSGPAARPITATPPWERSARTGRRRSGAGMPREKLRALLREWDRRTGPIIGTGVWRFTWSGQPT